MTTMGPIRPPPGLRQRRESTRPSQLRSSTRIAHNEADNTAAARNAPEMPLVFKEDYILEKFRGSEPSLKIHLYQTFFRFEHQDGNWPYNSPMKCVMNHLKERTVPHEMMEEMNKLGVQYYDGCLIVRTYNYRLLSDKAPVQNSAKKKDDVIPGSIHNWNDHLTPSPFVPFPTRSSNSPKDKRPSSSGSQQGKDKREALQDVGHAGPKGPVIQTCVLFPTALSRNAEMELFATTPMPDLSSRRPARTAQTPISAHPPTPINSIPPTPSTGRAAKRQKMILDETNIHEFEAGVINATAPALYLEPAHSMAESLDIIEATAHPMNKNPSPALKTRKRTTAELAADEAQFNADQNFMLLGDTSAAGTGAAQMNGEGEGLRGGGTAFEPRFARFKTLENIKIQHEEVERTKKEDEARQAQLKREQAANEVRMREREAASQQQAEHNRLMAQQEQQRQHALQQEQMRRAQAAAAQASGNMMGSQQHHMQMTQPPQNSPMIRQQTPMQASPVMNANAVATHAMGGVPMAPTSSSQAGSPPRPPSAIPHSAGAQHMARQMSRQQSSQHPGSTHGTPQMVQGTPQMGQAVPVTRHMTPQPGRVNQHGSPVGMQGTPMMMNTPQMQVTGMSQEQMMRIQQMRRLQQQNAMASGSPQNMSQEQMQILRQQHLAQVQAQNQMAQHQQGSNVGTPQQYNAQLQQQMRSQMNQIAGGTPNGVQQRPPGQGNPMMGNAGNVGLANMTSQQQQAMRMKQRREQMIMRMVQHFGGSLPPQIQNMIQHGGGEGLVRAWQLTMQHQAQQQQNQGQQQNSNQQGGGGGGQGMNMGSMGNMGQMNMGGMNMGNINMGTVTTGTGQNGATQVSQMPIGNGNNMQHQMEMMRQMQIRQQQQQAAQAVANQQHAQQQVQNGGQGGGGQAGGPGGMPGGGAGNPDQQAAQHQYMARLIRQQQILSQRNQMQAQQQQQQQQGQQQGGHPQQQMMGQMNGMGGMGGMWQQGGGMRPGQPGSMG